MESVPLKACPAFSLIAWSRCPSIPRLSASCEILGGRDSGASVVGLAQHVGPGCSDRVPIGQWHVVFDERHAIVRCESVGRIGACVARVAPRFGAGGGAVSEQGWGELRVCWNRRLRLRARAKRHEAASCERPRKNEESSGMCAPLPELIYRCGWERWGSEVQRVAAKISVVRRSSRGDLP